MWRIPIILFALSLLFGCDSEPVKLSTPNNRSALAIPEYLSSFRLLNEAGEPAPAYLEQSGKSPFGVLLGFIDEDRGPFLCSLTHVQKGYVLTAAHCIDEDRDPSKYWVAFYTASGERKNARVISMPYVGPRRLRDVALLKVDPDAVVDWDTAEGSLWDPTLSGTGGSDPFEVTVSAFDPFPSGMFFRSRTCWASRRLPIIVIRGTSSSGKLVKRQVPMENAAIKADANLHFFYDGCERAGRTGNSGGWVTVKGDWRKILGPTHWVIGPNKKEFNDISAIEYDGPSGPILFQESNAIEKSKVWVGTSLWLLQKSDTEFPRFPW